MIADKIILSGLLKSVYVRNLPPAVTEDEIADVFKNFGKIIPDGVAIKLKKVLLVPLDSAW